MDEQGPKICGRSGCRRNSSLRTRNNHWSFNRWFKHIKYGRVKYEAMHMKWKISSIHERKIKSTNCLKDGQPTSKHPCEELVSIPRPKNFGRVQCTRITSKDPKTKDQTKKKKKKLVLKQEGQWVAGWRHRLQYWRPQSWFGEENW